MASTYPVASDISDLLTSVGIAPGSILIAPILAAAISRFERETGWVPFKGTQAVELYNPPGPVAMSPFATGGGQTVLRLRNGLVSVNSITASGVVKTVGTDVYMVKTAAGWPCELLRFAFPTYGQPGSISIDGLWGFSATVDDAAWESIRQDAAASVCDAILQKIRTIGISTVKDDDVTIQYDPKMISGEAATWRMLAADARSLFVRTTAGI